jgi:hypothetical protein
MAQEVALEVEAAVYDSYYNATFDPGDLWVGPSTVWGWSVAGYLSTSDIDTVATAYPNRRFAVGTKRKITIANECVAEAGVAAPANDDVAGAEAVDPEAPLLQITVPGTLTGATLEPGEATAATAAGVPDPCRTVWYSWTPDTRVREIHARVEKLLGEPISPSSVRDYLRKGCRRRVPLFEYCGEHGYRLAGGADTSTGTARVHDRGA